MRRCCTKSGWQAAALGLAAVLLFGQPATAFYWYGWPGSGTTPTPTIHNNNNSQTPGGNSPNSPGDPTDPITPTNPTPSEIPEPATLVVTAIGLLTVGVARRLRRKDDTPK